MYDAKIILDGIDTVISFHENFNEELEQINKRSIKQKKWDFRLDHKAIVSMILSQGEGILSLTNDSLFILIEPSLKIGIGCSIYVSGYSLEIEVFEIYKNIKRFKERQKIKEDGCCYKLMRCPEAS